MDILLDTNVVSELMKPQPDPAVATRNVRDFDYVGLEIINPWDEVIGVREPQASYGFARAA